MAIKRTLKLNNGLGEFIEHFICDTIADLDDLPGLEDGTISGSVVLCLENKTKYMLSVAGEWKEAPAEGISKEALLAILEDKADLVNGLVPGAQLPSFVDDVLEFDSLTDFPEPGEEGKIYVAIDTNKTYRWSGSTYIPLTPDEIDGNLTKLQVKRGLEDELPTLAIGESGFTTDSHKLFVGTDAGNKRIDREDIRVGIVRNLLTNTSGRVLSNYTLDMTTMVGLYPYVNIQYQNNPITEAQARTYLKYILGSSYLPVYDYDFPTNHYVIDGDGNLWKPQWTDIGEGVYQLHMYILNKIILSQTVPAEGDILVFKDGVWKSTDGLESTETIGYEEFKISIKNGTLTTQLAWIEDEEKIIGGKVKIKEGSIDIKGQNDDEHTGIFIQGGGFGSGEEAGLLSKDEFRKIATIRKDGTTRIYEYGNEALKIVDEKDGMPIVYINDELQLGRVNKDDKVGLWAADRELISYDNSDDKIVIANKITIMGDGDVYLGPNAYFTLGNVAFAADERLDVGIGDGLFDDNDRAIATYKDDTHEYFYGGGKAKFNDYFLELYNDSESEYQIILGSDAANQMLIGDYVGGGHSVGIYGDGRTIAEYNYDNESFEFAGGVIKVNTTSAKINLGTSNYQFNDDSLYLDVSSEIFLRHSGNDILSYYGNAQIDVGVPLGLKQVETLQRPDTQYMTAGSVVYDTDLGLPIVWNGTKWIKFDGSDA